MLSEREVSRNAKSRVYLASLTPEKRRKQRIEVLRRFSKNNIEPLSDDDRSKLHFIIRGLKDRGDLRCGFDLVEVDSPDAGEGKIRVVETFKTTNKRRMSG